jgi:hypothetical protein
MKRGDDGAADHSQVSEQVGYALAHFAGRLIGEGDGEDGFRRDVVVVDEVADAVGDDAGFTGAGAGKD